MEDAREAEQRRRRAEGDRVRAVRERIDENQPAFAQRLTAEAKKLGLTWLRYDNTIVSKLELGTRGLSIDDTIVVAAVDPDERGRAWLAWGDDNGALAMRRPAPFVEPLQAMPNPRAAPSKKAANDRSRKHRDR